MAQVLYVGVLNITPDSFSDGGKFTETNHALTQAIRLFADGASLVDIGAESTNPNSQPLTPQQEIERLVPLIPKLIKQFGSRVFTLDTYHPETAAWAFEQGLRPIINDVSGLHNPEMHRLVIIKNASVIISHLPKTADGIPTRAHRGELVDSVDKVVSDLLETASVLEGHGVPKEHIILDPGIGFGKTMRLNWQLLEFPNHVPEYNVMLGYSRKRFLHTDPVTGAENPEAILLKTNAKRSKKDTKSYEDWLAKQHAKILTNIKQNNYVSAQTIYIRLHAVPPI